jgi:hypothetical protein
VIARPVSSLNVSGSSGELMVQEEIQMLRQEVQRLQQQLLIQPGRLPTQGK